MLTATTRQKKDKCKNHCFNIIVSFHKQLMALYISCYLGISSNDYHDLLVAASEKLCDRARYSSGIFNQQNNRRSDLCIGSDILAFLQPLRMQQRRLNFLHIQISKCQHLPYSQMIMQRQLQANFSVKLPIVLIGAFFFEVEVVSYKVSKKNE